MVSEFVVGRAGLHCTMGFVVFQVTSRCSWASVFWKVVQQNSRRCWGYGGQSLVGKRTGVHNKAAHFDLCMSVFVLPVLIVADVSVPSEFVQARSQHLASGSYMFVLAQAE